MSILSRRTFGSLVCLLLSSLNGFAEVGPLIPKWSVFEISFQSRYQAVDPLHDVEMKVIFTSSSGESSVIDAFWDGGKTWKARFSPNEFGRWIYSTTCSNERDTGLHHREGYFLCSAGTRKSRFDQHGPVQVSRNGRFLEHADGTPFLWLADTVWNGPLLSSMEEWQRYLTRRQEQKFTAVQWVTTQWRAAPSGDRQREKAFSGAERIKINPGFFSKLDRKVEANNAAGLLNAPVLLWAIAGEDNPGDTLPVSEAVLLARYMVARWGAYNNIWILAGDGDYRKDKASRWHQIGRQVFGDEPHAPVVMHPGGRHWIWDEFAQEPWINIIGYQSGHGLGKDSLQWLTSGPPAKDWRKEPVHPFINLEPCYENHLAYETKRPIEADSVRRALYWSLLVAPTAGVTYGAHGVWDWSDGTKPPANHPNTGTGLPWEAALHLPGAGSVAHISKLFGSIDYWKLRPADGLLQTQPGEEDPAKFIAAAQTERGDLTVVYTPAKTRLMLNGQRVPKDFLANWFNPRTGEDSRAEPSARTRLIQFDPPGDGDWVLVLQGK